MKKIIKRMAKTVMVFGLIISLGMISNFVTSNVNRVKAASKEVQKKNKKKKQTKTQYLFTTLVEKTNSAYQWHSSSSGAAYKIKLKKNKVVIYGSVSEMDKLGFSVVKGTVSNIGKHTYKLAKKVICLSRGDDGPDIIMYKKQFKKSLKSLKDSQLALILEIKNEKVTKIIISS